MALITNYATLQNGINAIAKRGDVSSNIDLLIQMGEDDILNDDMLGGSEKVDTSMVTAAGVDLVSLPTDFAGARSLEILTSPAAELKYRTPKQLYEDYDSTESGPPEAYTILGRGGANAGTYQVQLRPIPSGINTLRLTYNAKLARLSVTSTNWLLTQYPSLYVYAALRHCAAFAIEDERIPTWEAAYQNILAKVRRKMEDIMYPNGLQMNLSYE